MSRYGAGFSPKRLNLHEPLHCVSGFVASVLHETGAGLTVFMFQCCEGRQFERVNWTAQEDLEGGNKSMSSGKTGGLILPPFGKWGDVTARSRDQYSFDRVVGSLAGLHCRRQSASTKPAQPIPSSHFEVGFPPEGRWRSRSWPGLNPENPACLFFFFGEQAATGTSCQTSTVYLNIIFFSSGYTL